MSRNKLVVLLGLLILVLVLGTAAALYIRQGSLPVYAEGELPPTDGYGNNTLTLGDATYVSGRAEFRLRPAEESFGYSVAIGRTAGGERRILRPKNQTGLDYIYTTGDMMGQTVYRNRQLAPLELRDMRVREIQLAGGNRPGYPRKSQDAALIQEMMASLIAQDTVTLHPDYDAGDQGYRLDLLLEQVPGLIYGVDMLIDRAGHVYISTQSELGQDLWNPAGALFTRWAQP